MKTFRIVLAASSVLLVLASSAKAGGGWYLMGPPVGKNAKGEWVSHSEYKLADWDQWESYDTAKECRDGLQGESLSLAKRSSISVSSAAWTRPSRLLNERSVDRLKV